jgi:16S rRNA (cytidine1402-2'-O)-methyltransferase
MALWIVPTPIGNPGDITERARSVLQTADFIIVEEFKESTANLRSIGITGKTYQQLNEHSTKADVLKLAELCQNQTVALVSDCGTPGFCDPGFQLVAVCRAQRIAVHALPGASSLMTLLSLASQRIETFLFRGFLSAETGLRSSQWRDLKTNSLCIVMMDTPYRFNKMMKEVSEHFPQRKVLVACNLTQPEEQIWEGPGAYLNPLLNKVTWLQPKPEFLILVYPEIIRN